MKFQITKRLNSKDENQYNNLDKIFKAYIDGSLLNKLISMGYSKIEIFHKISKKNNASYLMIDCRYFNMVISYQFYENDFNLLYAPVNVDSDKELEKYFKEERYNDNFYLEELINKLHAVIINDKRFNKNYYESKKIYEFKAFKIIYFLSGLIFALGLGILCIFALINKDIIFDWWVGVLLIIPCIVFCVCYFIDPRRGVK